MINSIAEKLGIAAEYVVPALARYNIAECIIGLIYTIISLILFIIFMRICIKLNERKDSMDSDLWFILMLLSICATIAFSLTAIDNFGKGINIIKWIMAPEGATINYILSQIGGK